MPKALLAFVFLLLSLPAWAAPSADARARHEIEGLIAAVESMPGAVFIRNGSEHDAKAAAAHLRLKWKNAGSRVQSAEDFIRWCATESSLSGKRYRIRLADGKEMDSAAFFTEQLAQLRHRDMAASATH